MTEWRELKTGLEVFQAKEAGDEVQVDAGSGFGAWNELAWYVGGKYRARPRKKTKTVVLREALMMNGGEYYTLWTGGLDRSYWESFVRWLDTPERVVEVEE